MDGVKRVAVLVASSYGYGGGCLEGILAYSRRLRQPWIVRMTQGTRDFDEFLRIAQPQGVIAHVASEEIAGLLSQVGCPVVSLSNVLPRTGLPRIGIDERAVGILAAEHLLDRGFRSFGMYGLGALKFARERMEGFTWRISQAGRGPINPGPYVDADTQQGARWWADWPERIAKWLPTLSLPAGVFCCNDSDAVRVSHICFESGLRIPEDVALIGVDNDERDCRLAYPPLSSVDLRTDRVGQQAAALLDGLMSGQAPPAQAMLLPPVGVVTRQSTDIFAVTDPVVAGALQLIRERVGDGITVDTLLDELGISRRSLEYKFRDAIGRTPLTEIHRQRIDRVKHLLTQTDQPLNAIARETGFSTAGRLCTVFRKHVGQTPMQFRASHASH